MEEYSYSKITRYIECPLSYMRKYLNEEIPDSHGVTESGLFMHKLMEKYENGVLQQNELLEYFENKYDKNVLSNTVLNMGNGFRKDMYNIYYNGYRSYLEDFTGIPNCKKIIDVERKFNFRYSIKDIEPFSITGVIDLVFQDNEDKLIVLDHKSKKKFKNKKEKGQYSRQLYLYAYALKNIYNKLPDILIFNMLRGEPVYIDFNEKDMYETLEWFANTVEEIRNTITYDAKKDTFFCNNWCCLGRNELCDI